MATTKTSLADFEKTVKETGKKKDLAIQGYLEDNALFKEHDRIILSIPTTKQSVRLAVTKVAAEENNLANKLDIAYYFNDGSMLFQTSLDEDGYEWDYEKSFEAQGVTDNGVKPTEAELEERTEPNK